MMYRIALLQNETEMRSETIHIASQTDMVALGQRLAEIMLPGDVVGLCGDLGAGKTFLCTVIARAIGVPACQPVHSPSYTLINEYTDGRVPVYHMDLYRLSDPGELYDLGIWEYYERNGVCLVEWCDRFDDLWPQDALVLHIALGDGEQRRVRLCGKGRGEALVVALVTEMSSPDFRNGTPRVCLSKS